MSAAPVDSIQAVQAAVAAILRGIGDPQEQWCAFAHLFGTSQACALLAARRGVDVATATIAGLLHDIFEYERYDSLPPLAYRPDHGHRNAARAREMLDALGVTDAAQTDAICQAIAHHGYKDAIQAPLDEVLKDADVLHKQTGNVHLPVHPVHARRFAALAAELGLAWHDRVGTWA